MRAASAVSNRMSLMAFVVAGAVPGLCQAYSSNQLVAKGVPGSFGTDQILTSAHAGLWVGTPGVLSEHGFVPAEVGQSFPMANGDLAGVIANLTNGNNDNLWPGMEFRTYFFSESTWFSDVAGGNGTDLAGFRIDSITATLNSLSLNSPGSDPQGDGNWTDVTYNYTLRIYGAKAYGISGFVSGLSGSGLALALAIDGNPSQALPISANGLFDFPQPAYQGDNYSVTITQQPDDPAQTCTINSGDGLVDGAVVQDITVDCVNNGLLVPYPAQADFQVFEPGDVATAQPLALINAGPYAMTISSVSLAGADAADFSLISDACSGASLNHFESCAVQVDYAPLDNQRSAAMLSVQSDAPGSPQQVPLSGQLQQIFPDGFE